MKYTFTVSNTLYQTLFKVCLKKSFSVNVHLPLTEFGVFIGQCMLHVTVSYSFVHSSVTVFVVHRELDYTVYRAADKSLARPGRNKLQRQNILMFIYPIYNHNWRNINTIYIYNKTSIKRDILTIKQNISGSRSG
jgi:hypothetical protein